MNKIQRYNIDLYQRECVECLIKKYPFCEFYNDGRYSAEDRSEVKNYNIDDYIIAFKGGASFLGKDRIMRNVNDTYDSISSEDDLMVMSHDIHECIEYFMDELCGKIKKMKVIERDFISKNNNIVFLNPPILDGYVFSANCSKIPLAVCIGLIPSSGYKAITHEIIFRLEKCS